MRKLSIFVPALSSLVLITIASGTAIAQDCSSQLDDLQGVLDQAELASEQLEPMREHMDEARQLATDGDDEGCSAAAAKLQSAMLQVEGIDHQALCDRAKSEGDLGEAGMSGNQDVQSALQTSCDDQQ